MRVETQLFDVADSSIGNFHKKIAAPPRCKLSYFQACGLLQNSIFISPKKLLLSWNGLRFMGPCVAFDLNTAEGNCKHYFKLPFFVPFGSSLNVVCTYFRSIFGFLLAYLSLWFLTHIFDKLESFFGSFFLKCISLKNFFLWKEFTFYNFLCSLWP